MSTKTELCQTDSIPFDFERAQGFRSKGRFCDLVIQSTVNDNKEFIKCHRVILASVSPFFEDKLGKGSIVSLSIPEIDIETLEVLIDYIYGAGGFITLNTENVFKIFNGAKHLKLSKLVTSCLEFMRSYSVTFKDVVQIFKFSLTDNLLMLRETCIDFILKNFENVKSFGFLDLDFQQVKVLVENGIESQNLSMANILLAVSDWLHSNKEERLEHAFSLISKIPLSKIRLKNLRRLLREDDFLTNIPEVHNLYVDALEEMGLQFEKIEIEKRKAEELNNDHQKEIAMTDGEHLSEPGPTKRGRFPIGNECTTNKADESSDGHIRVRRASIDLVEKYVETPRRSLERIEKAVLYFVGNKVVRPGFQKSIVSFDLETKEIGILGPILDSQNYTKLAYHNHKLFCLALGETKKSDEVRYSPVTTVYNFTSKQWEENAPDLVKLGIGFEAVVLGEYLYAFGGLTQSGESCNVERLKIQKPFKEWEAASKLPTGSCGPGICVARGCIYVIGGIKNLHINSPTISSTLICYIPQSDKWVSKEQMPMKRRGFAVAVIGRHIYILGGSESATGKHDPSMSSVEIYDTELDSWNQGVPMNKNRIRFSAIVHNNCIYAIGGDSCNDPTMERFSLERQVWEDMGSLPDFGHYTSVVLHVEEL